MTKNDYKQKAIKWLKILRSGTGQYNRFICLLHKEVHKGHLSFEDIGTSEKELLNIRREGCKTVARKWLGFLRSDPGRSNFFTEKIIEAKVKGFLSFEDIGTSQEELSSYLSALD